MKTLIAAALIATVPFAASAANQPIVAAPAVVSISADKADLVGAYVQEVKFGHFKKKAFKKGFYGGHGKKKFIAKKYYGKKFFF